MTDVPTTDTHRGEQPDQVPPVADRPWQLVGHFRAGDPIMLGGGHHWYPLTAEAENYANGGQYLPGGAEQYRHRGGRCRSCAADVARQGAAATADEHTYRATFTERGPPARRHPVRGRAGAGANRLVHPRLPPEPARPATGLVAHRPGRCRLEPPRGRVAELRPLSESRGLAGAHPGASRVAAARPGPLDANAGPRGPGIADAYQLLAERGHRPYLDVALWVTENARISVDPIGLLLEHPPSVPSATATDVDDLLVAAGRLRQHLHYPNEPAGSGPTSGWCPPSPPPGERVPKAGSPRPATATPDGC